MSTEPDFIRWTPATWLSHIASIGTFEERKAVRVLQKRLDAEKRARLLEELGDPK